AKGSSGNPRGRSRGIPNPKRHVPDLVARPLSAQALSDPWLPQKRPAAGALCGSGGRKEGIPPAIGTKRRFNLKEKGGCRSAAGAARLNFLRNYLLRLAASGAATVMSD